MSQVTIITSTGKKVHISSLGANMYIKNNPGSFIEGQTAVAPIKKKENQVAVVAEETEPTHQADEEPTKAPVKKKRTRPK
jgi:hypothetical protein